MYGLQPSASAQSEHLEAATKMANEIIERFNPVEQNEMLKHIYDLTKDRRAFQLRELEERCQFLQKTLTDLG